MNTELPTATFLEKLRTTTAESHKSLEALPISMSIMNPKVSKQEYGLYLTLMYDVVNDIEANLFPQVSGIITDIEERKKTQLLENDLQYLDTPKSGFTFPVTGNKEEISLPFALGIVYVIEGSTLGGRVILKNISGVLGYDEANGAQYFSGYGNTTGSHWKNFLAQFSAYAASCGCEDEIIAGAEYAYNAIAGHFTTKKQA